MFLSNDKSNSIDEKTKRLQELRKERRNGVINSGKASQLSNEVTETGTENMVAIPNPAAETTILKEDVQETPAARAELTIPVMRDTLAISCPKKIKIPEGTSFIPSNTFSCKIERLSIPDSVTELGENCFSYCTLPHLVEINATVIGEGAFHHATGFSIHLNKVKVLPRYAFAYSEFGYVKCENALVVREHCFTGINTHTNCSGCDVTFGELRVLERLAFAGSKADLWGNIDKLEYIGRSCFESCEDIAIQFERNLAKNQLISSLRLATFAGSNVRDVTIPDNVSVIGDYCFMSCTRMYSVKLPKKLERIGKFCFCNCTELSRIRLPAKPVFIEDYAFYNSGLSSVFYGNEDTDARGNSFYLNFSFEKDDKGLKRVVISKDCDHAFEVGQIMYKPTAFLLTKLVNYPPEERYDELMRMFQQDYSRLSHAAPRVYMKDYIITEMSQYSGPDRSAIRELACYIRNEDADDLQKFCAENACTYANPSKILEYDPRTERIPIHENESFIELGNGDFGKKIIYVFNTEHDTFYDESMANAEILSIPEYKPENELELEEEEDESDIIDEDDPLNGPRDGITKY